MSIYIPPSGDRIRVMVAETVRQRRERQAIRAALLRARKAGLKARHTARAAHARADTEGAQP